MARALTHETGPRPLTKASLYPLSLLALVGVAFVTRLFLMPSYIEFIDGYAFVSALERYDLL